MQGWLRALLALVFVAALIPLCVPLAWRVGLTDKPGGRKDHAEPTAVHGGLVISW